MMRNVSLKSLTRYAHTGTVPSRNRKHWRPRILSDADKLDAMGAVGIARTFIRAGEHHGEIGDAVDHIRNKLLNLNGLMYTETAKRVAEERHRYLCIFLETLTDEINLPGSLPDPPL
jgi:uncharacterized protein